MGTAYAVVWGMKAHHKEIPSVHTDWFPSPLLLIGFTLLFDSTAAAVGSAGAEGGAGSDDWEG